MLTKAIAGIARSGVTRSGYPVLLGAKVPLYALSNVARSGATRSNYTSSRPFLSVGGVQRIGDVIATSLTKADAINNTPVTLTFTAYGWVPVEGADVIVTFGSVNNARREFGGTILSTVHRYAGKPAAQNMLYDVSCIDYTWGLDNRKVSGNYTKASVAAIAASLLTFAPGYTLRVEADIGAEILDQITFTEQNLSSAFAQLAKRVGGDFLCDFRKVVHLFYVNTALTAPRIVNAVHPTLHTIQWRRDLSQVATRILGNFGGSNALAEIAPGAAWLPVETAAWYLPAGGRVLVGQQRVTYAGLEVGGGGSLVGPGASPTGAPNAALLPGAGVNIGSHDYAVTFKTANGESIAGPRLTVPVGVFLAPSTAPTAGAPTAGPSGPGPGVHDYAVSFVISTGETTPGPRMTASTDVLPAPTTGPTPDSLSIGPGPDPGQHDYAVTFLTAGGGETTPGPIGGQITTPGNIPAPTSSPSGSAATGVGLSVGERQYAVTFVTATGETTPGPTRTLTTPAIPPPSTVPTWDGSAIQGGQLPAGIFPANQWAWACSFVSAAGETGLSGRVVIGNYSSTPPMPYMMYRITFPLGPPGTTARRTYRTVAMADASFAMSGQLWYEDTINDNTTTTRYMGAVYDGNLGGANHPTAALGTMNLSGIPTGPTGTTARRLYRTVAGGTQLLLLATIADNTTTTYSDTKADATLGAAPPPINNAGGAQTVHVSSIPTVSGANGTGAWRALYRRSGGAGLRFVAYLQDNTTRTYVDTTPNASLGVVPPTANSTVLRQIPLTKLPLGNALVIARKLYRTPANTGGGTLKLVASIADNTTTDFLDTVNDANLGAAALTVGTAQAAQVQLSAIPLGAAAVIARVLYRTKAGLSQLQALVTLADNTTTTYLDVVADAALGVNAPTSDNSLLQQPTGNVLVGSPTLPCATVAAFRPAGGWAIVGSQTIRYTGISGNALLGIPATGPGAITATITYNTTVVAAPMLTGIPATGLGMIKYPILKGDPVNIFVQVDDLNAQAAVRTQLPGSDGIIEDEIQDGRLSYTEGLARCQARLELLGALDSEGKVGVITVSYVCRDINTVAGATATINLGPPINLRGDFLIQRVSVARFHVPHLYPTYTVEASSLRFSAEEMLRLLRQGAL
jgi:hypothetical protein